MTLHYEDGGLRLFHGSNRDILPTFADASFDSIVTDPPYELGFMGKGWDSSGIAYDVEVWRECFRVLKPGGYLLSFGGTRTWHRIATAIEDAGFEIRDSIAWLYGSGFPKSLDVSKQIDKNAGARRDPGAPVRDRVSPLRNERYASGPAGFSTEKGSKLAAEAGEPVTDDAKKWQGWGTALKPAFEPIIVARKPIAGTVAANVLAYGTGALNIDATRVATSDKLGGGAATGSGLATKSDGWSRPWMSDADAVDAHAERVRENIAKAESLGRFPSNVLLEESQATALDAQTGTLTSGTGAVKRASSAARDGNRGAALGKESRAEGTEMVSYGDSGGASRYFPTFRYEAKAPGSERPTVDGVAHATVKPLELMRWLVRLVTRRGGHVLDLFAGSGTTAEAALLEGMDCTLIELEADHLPLIMQRIRKPLQTSLFGWEEASA
ncbi:DNA methyltransferase [Microbacterium sp. CFBP9023]|uniref:DNA-methyltransferase n=1 Tax=Microbacterium sp. CFBP9023 TaxID=3096535 RepID=UPI002A6B7C3A|nr:DNA methyltransferase [Microbacterium sp. CFBP9023]MDY0984622.1 DNA methyltransferase [Microbacterium sp. CFBP9023]